VQIDQINRSGIVERYIVFKTSGSIKERTQTSPEMGISCQRNGHWHGLWHGQRPIICQSSAAGQYAGRGCALIRQLANCDSHSRQWALPWPVALGSDQSFVSRLWQGGMPEGAVH